MSIPSQPGVTSASNISPHPIIVRPTKAEPFIVVDLQGKRFVQQYYYSTHSLSQLMNKK